MSWNKFLITHDFLKITEKVSEVHPLTFRKLDGYGSVPHVLRCYSAHFFVFIRCQITNASMNSFAIIPTFDELK
ncbi:hypothetical protein OEV82_01735, partial [Caldibacillus thermolactis]|nr:hypothetical protein [Pallidibacillus thermolactis]